MNLTNFTEIIETSTSPAPYLLYLIPVKLLIGIINFIFNGYIIQLVIFKIKKKTYSNILFLSNAIADFTSGLVSIPSMTLFTTMGYWSLGKATCVIWVINDFAITSISAYTLLIIATHRYLQIRRPVKTTEKMTLQKWSVLGLKWLVIYSFWITSVLVITSGDDFKSESCYYTYTFAYVLSADLVFFCLPVLGVLVINSLIFFELVKKKKARSKIGIQKTTNASLTNNTLAGGGTDADQMKSCETERSFGVKKAQKPKKHQNSDTKQFKALVCLYVVTMNLLLLFSVFCITWPLKAYCSSCVSDLVLEIGYWVCYSNSTVNPILLLIFHEKFNKHFRKSLRRFRDIF